MPQDHHVTPAQPPEDFQEYADARFGFKVYMPKRFEILPETVDPLARMIRGLNDLPEEEAAKLQPRLPIGFWDPDVVGELENGDRQPLRLFEYEALGGRDEPLSPRSSPADARGDARVPAGDPGERADAGLRVPRDPRDEPGSAPGAHVRVLLGRRVAGPLRRRPRLHRVGAGPDGMFHVYHHCSGEEWKARRPEFDAILASFALLAPGEDQEMAASAAAVAAFEAAKAAGDSTEDAFKAGQAAFEAAHAPDGAAPKADAAPDADETADADEAGGAAAKGARLEAEQRRR